jgi:hypothetical protein
MARSSGKVGVDPSFEDFSTNQVIDSRSTVHYRVVKNENNYYWELSKPLVGSSEDEVFERRKLDYFIGSGAAGRGYLFALDGFLFQAPVSYYSSARRWDIAPGFGQYDYLKLPRAVEAGCLECHVSQLQRVEGTQNGYADPPFLENGISCERCHGPGGRHIDKMRLAQGGDPEICNPAKLEPSRRDSICAQCHLEGEARIARSGRSLATFQPGELLSDHIVSLVWLSPRPQGVKVIGHVEKLWQSKCKKTSGERLWCGSCHDAHSPPEESQKLQYFRGKCLGCHQSMGCTASTTIRAKAGNNCIACHMPKTPATDGGHTVFTDHSIPRVNPVDKFVQSGPVKDFLTPFSGSSAGPREFGLAYARVGLTERNNTYYGRALDLLREAQEKDPNDSQVSLELGRLYAYSGDEEKAMLFQEKAFSQDPTQVVAGLNLGGYLAKRGRIAEAIRVWESVLARNPGLTAARINLARVQLRQGSTTAARDTIKEAIKYDPDLRMDTELSKMLYLGESGNPPR